EAGGGRNPRRTHGGGGDRETEAPATEITGPDSGTTDGTFGTVRFTPRPGAAGPHVRRGVGPAVGRVRRTRMDLNANANVSLKLDDSLKALIESGKRKGYLTFAQVNEYLPDDAVNPDKLDQLLQVLEEHGIELIEESEAEERESDTRRPGAAEEAAGEVELAFLDEDDG